MRAMTRLGKLTAIALLPSGLLLAPALGAGPAAMLGKLERGQWLVKPYEKGAPARSLCVSDPKALLQLEHGGGCSQEVLTADGNRAVVEYSCGGRGFGHSSIRLQTPRSATIDTQGMIDGRPFAYRAVARRSGPCRQG
jgi:hypothetical protein